MTSGTISIDNVQRVHELSRRCDENARRVMRVTTKCLLKLLERVTERANPPSRSLQIGGAGAASGPEAQRSRSRISAAPPRPPPQGGRAAAGDIQSKQSIRTRTDEHLCFK